MQLATLTNQKVYNLQFYKTKGGQDYCTFSVSAIKPQKNGVYGKFYCQAFGSVCSDIQRMKLKEGSIIDLQGEFSFYQKRDASGNLLSEYGCSIMANHLSFSELIERHEEKKEEKKETGNGNRFYDLANSLNTNPFA